MEGAWRNSGEGGAVKQEKRVESSGDEEGLKEEIDLKENNLCSAKAAVDEVREENQKLKRRLNQILKDYQTLQIQFNDIVSQEVCELDKNTAYIPNQETELVSLTLGRTSTESKKDEKMRNKSGADKQDKEGLPLGLDWKFENSIDSSSKTSPENSVVELTEETGERSPQNVPQKTMRSEDDEVSQQNPTKRARVSVRIRCDTPTMNDGCQWRKYGQKISKGNPCPRAYYRCTVAPSCPVRKQVQRCVDDMTILITTYEGTHNHPLPVSATGMASTTSAAASMLLSGSSTSGTILNSSFNTTTSAIHGLNFNLSDNSKPKQFYLPHSSTYASPSHPTITLDLTSTSSSSQFSKMSSSLYTTPRYSSTNLNFSSLESNPAAFAWNGIQSYFKNNQVGNSLNFFGRQPPQENYYQSIMQKANPNSPQQTLPSDSIVAATKAITSDPSFQSALATALTSIMGNNGNQSGNSFKL